MEKNLTILVLFLVSLIPCLSKPLTINFEKVLGNADVVIYGVVEEYTDSSIRITSETMGTFLFRSRIDSSIIPFERDKIGYYTGYWPKPGEEVLAVVNEEGDIVMFAFKVGEYFRFWDPRYNRSLTIFMFEPPAIKLPEEQFNTNEPNSCWDGCLYPIKNIKEWWHIF